jgi:hypothetical protein
MDKPFRRLTDAEFQQLTPLEKRAYVDEAMKLAEAMRDAELVKSAQPRKPQDSPR